MNKLLKACGLAALLALAAGPIGAVQAQTAAPAAIKPPTAEAFGRQPALTGVSISPDGKYIAGITSPDGVKSYVTVWRTDAMDKPPVNLGCGDRSDCMGVSFIKSDRIALTVRQTYTQGNFNGHLFRTFISDIEGKNFRDASGEINQSEGGFVQVINTLPKDPKNVLVRISGDIYKLNVYNFTKAKIYTGSDKFGGEQFDLNGEIAARQSVDFDNGKVYIAQYIRNPANGNWEEHFRWYAANREPKAIVGFTDDPNLIYVATNEGQDKTGIFTYDIKQRKIVEPAFQIKLFDAGGLRRSRSPSEFGRLLGFTYDSATTETFWVDEKMGSVAKGLRKAFGVKTNPVNWVDIATGEKVTFRVADGADVEMTSWSDDFSKVIVVKSGASQPPEYYLLQDGTKVVKLGSSRPWLDTRALGDTTLVQYAARDGLMVPGFLTKPKASIWGPGPYPAIVLPHGGPWARDDMGWDSSGWTQYFAARGYAVLQPQYRGSEGWGQKLWRAGDSEWGQKMQDDKDDGAKWMIDQKIAAPDRIAMHGYSYGGYAAMAASVRPNGLYQCAVAGAGVAELETFRERNNQNRIQREFQRPTVNGLEPLSQAGNIKIPIFLYHGDRDTNVLISQSERFVAAAQKSGQPVKFLKLKDMGHSYGTWMSGQTAEVLTAVDNYLRTECGPGGL
ncbi:prolyl oligopeptidase family serine peptidase [Caulobacter sp. SLTY]|uniref:prolyl oligopeptidase family serine peptidase n=1 Tax=Caulobacter sp. SLTY TaxID=2683262 RepID=UPI001411EB2C|nr:prolyl oligopeptidase family serine peptidase [Caulobacter sp. SLTY]